MLCVRLSNYVGAKALKINENFVASRLYLNRTDIETFPNRLVFRTTQAKVQEFLQEISPDEGEEWITEEIVALGEVPFIVLPFILRTQDSAHTTFKQSTGTREAFEFGCCNPVLIINHNTVPTLCSGCPRSIELHGAVCPDYVEGSLSCLKVGMLTLERNVFALNERGELMYVTSNEENRGEELGSGENTANGNAETGAAEAS